MIKLEFTVTLNDYGIANYGVCQSNGSHSN